MNARKQSLSTYLFGVLSIYTIYAILYERLVMLPFENRTTGLHQYQQSPAAFVLFQTLFAWIFVVLFASFKLPTQQSKTQLQKVPFRKSFFCGLTRFFTIILFTQGLYETNFRFAFTVKTGTFAAGAILGIVYSIFGGALMNKTRKSDLFFGLIILGSMILFWVYDPEICYYVPIQPRVIGTVMMIVSVVFQGVLSIMQSRLIQNENVSPLRMQRDITSWLLVFAFIYTLFKWQLAQALDYAVNHGEYVLEVAILGFLCFCSQLFIFRATVKFQPNVYLYLTSAAMVLMVQISFSFTVHKYHQFQIIGISLAWLSIALVFALRLINDIKDSQMTQKTSFPYGEIHNLENQLDQV